MSTDLHDFKYATLQVNINHILVNYLLHHVSRTSITWWRNVDVNEITSCTWQSHCYREKHQEIISPEMWPPNSPDVNLVDYNVWVSFKRGFTGRGSMVWMSWKNVCWGSGGSWTTPSPRQHIAWNVLLLYMRLLHDMVATKSMRGRKFLHLG